MNNDAWVALMIATVGVATYGLIFMETKRPAAATAALTTVEEGVGCGVAMGAVVAALLTAAIFYLFTHLEFHP